MADDPRLLIASNRMKFGVFSWQGQCPQYDQLGDPGEIVYRRYFDNAIPIDTLLYYDKQGFLAGILNTYPVGAIVSGGKMLEKPGNVNMFVRPDVDDDLAVTRALLAESKRRWNLGSETPLRLAIGTDTAYTTAGAVIDGNRRMLRLSDLKR